MLKKEKIYKIYRQIYVDNIEKTSHRKNSESGKRHSQRNVLIRHKKKVYLLAKREEGKFKL